MGPATDIWMTCIAVQTTKALAKQACLSLASRKLHPAGWELHGPGKIIVRVYKFFSYIDSEWMCAFKIIVKG